MRRIALLSVHGSPLLPPGGRESGGMNVYVGELAKALGQAGLLVDVFTRWHHPRDPQVVELGEGVRVIHLEAGGRRPRRKEALYPYLPEFLCQLERYQEEHGLQYDVVHSHYWLSGWVGSFLRRRWRVPHVAMFHTLGEVKNRAHRGEREAEQRIKTERQVVAVADRIVAGSAEEKRQLVRLYGAQPHKVEVIPCGVDLDLFRPMDKVTARDILGFTEPKIVLFVGRIEPLKGVDILLNALPQLREDGEVRVVVAGGDSQSGKEMMRLRTLAMELGIEPNVTFLGSVPHTRLPYYYNAADVCVIPSYYESFGMVAVEAMACGTPVVAARVGGLQSTVRDGETGFLIPWHCPEPFAERLELLLGNEALQQNFGLAARTTAENFSWSLVAQQVMGLYESLAPGAGNGASAFDPAS